MERLERLRKDGLTVAQIVKISNGNISEVSVMDILEHKKVPLPVYKVLAGVLDVIEVKKRSET